MAVSKYVGNFPQPPRGVSARKGAHERVRELERKIGAPVEELPADLVNVLGKGLLAKVRVTAVRFHFSIPLARLGVPTGAGKRKRKVADAMSAHLRRTHSGSLLPKGLMAQLKIEDPEKVEHDIRMLFPKDYHNSRGVKAEPEEGDETATRTSDSYANRVTYLAIPTAFGSLIMESAFDRWQEKLDAAQARFYGVRDQLLEHYDSLHSAMRGNMRLLAVETYHHIVRATGEAPPSKDGKSRYSLRDWVRDFVEIAEEAWPSREAIRERFTVTVDYGYPPRPSEVESDLAAAAEIRAERQQSEAAMRIMERIKESEVARARTLVDQYVSTFKERVEEVCMPFLGYVAKNGRVSGEQVESLNRLSEMVRLLGQNVRGFEGLRTQMDSLDKLLAERKTIQDETDGKTVREQRADLWDNTQGLAGALARTVEVARAEAQQLAAPAARRGTPASGAQQPADLLRSIMAHQPVMAAAGRRGTPGAAAPAGQATPAAPAPQMVGRRGAR